MKQYNMHVKSIYSADIPIWAETEEEAQQIAEEKLQALDARDMCWVDDDYELNEDLFEPREYYRSHFSDKELTPSNFVSFRCTEHFMGQVLTFPDIESHVGMFWFQNEEGKFIVCDNTLGEPFTGEFDTLGEVVMFFDGYMPEDVWEADEEQLKPYHLFAEEVEVWLEQDKNEVVI